MAEFEAKITGIADLTKARQDFDAFKKSIEQPIKITVDTSGFNVVWGNLQKQAQSFGAQAGKQYANAMQNNIKNVKVDPSFINRAFSGLTLNGKINNGSLMDHLGADVKLAQNLLGELTKINAEGGQLQKITFSNGGESFEATIKNANTLVHVMGELQNNQWVTSFKNVTTDLTGGIKQAQQEAEKLTQQLDKVSQSFITGTFDANIAKMEQGLSNISQSVGSDLVKKASDAAAEYYRITQEIATSLNNPSQAPLQGEQLSKAYKDAETALKTYNNAMVEVKANTQQMLAEGAGARNANQVESWAKKNSKALKQYGDQLDMLAQKMREAKTQGELNDLNNQFKNIKAEASSLGLVGASFGDQLKKAFVHIGEFTGIYALTSKLRQLPGEMAQEVIKIDTAMTELRKVSTASASEISDYFDQAADSARAYGQTIDEVINSTASWTRLGYELNDAKILTDVTAELAQVGSGLNVESATEGLQSTIKGFGLAADEAKRVGDMINYVADTEPIDALGIVNGLERSSAVLRETNNSLEEAIGLITATTSVTQDATSAGTAWRTVALRITGAKNELEEAGLETDGMVESTAKLRDEIMAVAGVDILDETGKNFKSTVQIMRELSQVWGNLNEIERNGLLDKIAGKRGAVAVSAALQNWDIVEDTIRGASTESIGSMDQQLEVYNQSIQASLNKFKVAFQELSADLIDSNFIKGVVDFGTTIIKVIDELVKHIGVLGTALTGLGIAKIFTTATNGAKAVTGWGSVLSTVFSELATNTTTATERMTAMQLVLTALKGKAAGTGTALGQLFSGIGGFLASPVGIAASVAATVFAGYKIYHKQQEDLLKQASATTDSWNSAQTGIDEYKEKYTALNKQLEQGNLTESERIGIKQQLLDLQNEIVAKYGDQASGIDLVNGRLETQLGILSNISEETARRNLQDNDKAYQQSVNAMEKSRTYTLSNGNARGGMGVRVASGEMQRQIDELYTNANFTKFGDTFKFKGDATEFNEAVRDVLDGLNKLEKVASESDKAVLQSAINSAQKALEKNNEVLNKYQDNYKAYLEQNLFADGYGDELAEYARRTQVYNDALLGGNMDTIKEAKAQLDDYENTVNEIRGKDERYGDFFDEIANSVDKTTESIINFKDIIDKGINESTDGLNEYESDIKRTVNNIKALGLDGVDVRNILLNGGVGFGDLSELAKIFNPDFDFTNENEIATLADVLAELGIIASGTGDGINLVKDDFQSFLKVASQSIETVEKANAALVNSFGNKGLSMGIDAETGAITGDVAAIIAAYGDLKGYDAGVLFERTADGINVNTEALRALQSEQEAMVKADFVRKIAEAQNELSKAGTVEGKKYWEDQLETVKLLSTAYDGATSAYQKWIDAQKMTSPGSKYDTIVDTALKQAEEYYNKGLVGNPAFQAVAQLFSNEDLSLATTDEITEAYEKGVDTVKKYFTEGSEGANAFADKLVDLDLATKEWNSDIGAYDYDFSESGINTTELADELGISVDLVEAAFGKLQEYGFTINFVTDDQLAQLGTLREKADSARQKLAELADEEGKVGDADVSNVIDIDVEGLDTIDECNEAIEQINEAKANAEVDSDEYEYLDSLLQDITLMRDVLEQGTKPSVDDSDLVSAQDTYDNLVNRMLLLSHMNAAPGVYFDINNDEEVRELAETLLNMDDEEYKAKLGIDGIDTVEGIIDKLKQEHIDVPVTADTSGMQVNANTSATVDYNTGSVEGVGAQTAVLNYTTGTIQPVPVQSAKVDYSTNKIEKIPTQKAKIDYSNGYIEDVPDQHATANYSVSVSGLDALPKDGSRRTIYLDTYTVQHYKGTVTKSAFQNMSSVGSVTSGSSHANGVTGSVGLKHDETALINELGSEIVVRPSEDSWMIFNDGKPTFAPLKKGDVKIYCVHVQRCA